MRAAHSPTFTVSAEIGHVVSVSSSPICTCQTDTDTGTDTDTDTDTVTDTHVLGHGVNVYETIQEIC